MDISMLKRDLSMLLSQELESQLMPGETVMVSLPGSFGEALAVTDRRAFVIRDCDSGPGCTVNAHPLIGVTGAEAAASGTGGYIELKLTQAVTNPDEARVYFPTYDLEKFRQAAEFISQKVVAGVSDTRGGGSENPPTNRLAGGVSDAVAKACSQCGTAVEDTWAFCIQCGTQLRALCEHCGAPTPKGSKFCRQCGVQMTESSVECAKCGARVAGWYTYCTQCGSLRQTSCVACGARIIADYRHCGNCGRLLGSDRLDAGAARAAQRRLQEMRTANQEVATNSRTEDEEYHPPVIAQNLSAEEHNQRGRELFEDEDIDAAIEEFRRAAAMQPDNASYHCNLAVALDENEEDDEALSEYETTLRLDPKDLTALLSLGYMYNEGGVAETAQKYWNRVLEIAPDSPEAQEVRDNLRHQENL